MPNPKQRLDTLWPQAPLPLEFPSGHLDVWRVRLDEPAADPDACFLSPDEVARAGRFHFEKARDHFRRCRSALRSLLARYLKISADEIRFEYPSGGKPQLVPEQNPRALQFNVSHSADLALIAVGSEHRLGVDIEKVRDDVDASGLAERFFSARERRELKALPDHLQVQGFFACWTRKEAFLKATGEGLSFPLADFSVTTHPDLDPRVEEIKGSQEAVKRWFLTDLGGFDGFRATVAVERPYSRVDTYAWN